MRAESSGDDDTAINLADRLTDQTVSDDGWFVEIVRTLAPKDAGFVLHVLTGFEERTCYRYAAGDRKPPGYFVRALLRSEQGSTWLAALMDGCEAQWWRDLSRAAANHQKIEEIRALIER
jgi:hypothetical protein